MFAAVIEPVVFRHHVRGTPAESSIEFETVAGKLDAPTFECRTQSIVQLDNFCALVHAPLYLHAANTATVTMDHDGECCNALYHHATISIYVSTRINTDDDRKHQDEQGTDVSNMEGL